MIQKEKQLENTWNLVFKNQLALQKISTGKMSLERASLSSSKIEIVSL
jgi:hypothetical protein